MYDAAPVIVEKFIVADVELAVVPVSVAEAAVQVNTLAASGVVFKK